MIETERLLIRPFTLADVDAYAGIVADAEVMRYLGGPLSADDAHAYVVDCIERQRSSGISRYAVCERSSSALIGFCGFKDLTDVHGEVVHDILA